VEEWKQSDQNSKIIVWITHFGDAPKNLRFSIESHHDYTAVTKVKHESVIENSNDEIGRRISRVDDGSEDIVQEIRPQSQRRIEYLISRRLQIQNQGLAKWNLAYFAVESEYLDINYRYTIRCNHLLLIIGRIPSYLKWKSRRSIGLFSWEFAEVHYIPTEHSFLSEFTVIWLKTKWSFDGILDPFFNTEWAQEDV